MQGCVPRADWWVGTGGFLTSGTQHRSLSSTVTSFIPSNPLFSRKASFLSREAFLDPEGLRPCAPKGPCTSTLSSPDHTQAGFVCSSCGMQARGAGVASSPRGRCNTWCVIGVEYSFNYQLSERKEGETRGSRDCYFSGGANPTRPWMEEAGRSLGHSGNPPGASGWPCH